MNVPAKPKKKIAQLKPAEAAKARAERLYGRRAKYIVLAVKKLLEGVAPLGLQGHPHRDLIMIALSVEFGLQMKHCHSVGSWPRFVRQIPNPESAQDVYGAWTQDVYGAWWEAIRSELISSIGALRTCEGAAAALASLKFLVACVLGRDWFKLEADAIEAIPNRQIKKGQKDVFDPRSIKDRKERRQTAQVEA